MIAPLSRPYRSRHGQPIVDRVDTEIFRATYFGHCLDCTFCHDACCAHGVDVDLANAERILARRAELEAYFGTSADTWFDGAVRVDPDFPSGQFVRSAVVDGRCAFREPRGRGCGLHAFALARGEEVHVLKPMVSILFPLTFDRGLLLVSPEVADQAIVCSGPGPCAYDAVREALAWYFGRDLLAELDALRRQTA